MSLQWLFFLNRRPRDVVQFSLDALDAEFFDPIYHGVASLQHQALLHLASDTEGVSCVYVLVYKSLHRCQGGRRALSQQAQIELAFSFSTPVT